MADYGGFLGSFESRSEAGDEPTEIAGFWLQQLKLAEREDRRWVRTGRLIVKRYRDERRDSTSTGRQSAKFNILWSNVETLKPILYGRTPKPDVQRRHEGSDEVALLGAEIIERALSYEDDLDEFSDVMEKVVEDRLLPGRGTARVFYEPEFGEPEEDPEGEPDEDGETPTFRPVTSERAPVRYVFWEDYRVSPARSMHDVWWMGFRSYMTRDELVRRFGAKVGKQVTLDYTPKGLDDGGDGEKGPQADAFKKAQVWEIWDRDKKRVVWIAPSYPEGPLDKKSDPLELPGFFPAPRALNATMTNETMQPVADYSEYQDQAIELDVLTGRIDRLVSALGVKGLYDAQFKADISQLVNDQGTENMLIPVEAAVIYADKGGLEKAIMWLPMEQIAKVLIQLYDARERVKRTLYEITGMADILRGETNPNETLGAQQLKAQFATRRISKAQKDVARFARDLMRLRGCVIARHFSAETLAQMTGLPEQLPAMPAMPAMMIPAPPQQPAPPQPQQGMGPPGMPPMMSQGPMMGHNGGPPMQQPGGPGPVPLPAAGNAPGGGGAIAASPPPQPPVPGARLAPDGKHYVADPRRPGKYLMVA